MAHVVDFETAAVQDLLSEWDEELSATVAGFAPEGSVVDASDFLPPNGAFLLIERDGRRLACGGVRRLDDSVGEVKRLFVRAHARGQGIGGMLLASLERHASELGFAELRLDTHGGERSPAAFFRARGYQPIDDYNGNPYARYWFAKRLAPRIRNATADDAQSLPALLEQLGYPTSTAELGRRLESLLATPNAGALVAHTGEEIVGVATFQIFDLIYQPRPQCRLTALVVRSDHRRQGIGAALVEAVERAAREHNCYRIELTTRAGRADAVTFYAALGFTERPHRLVRMLTGDQSPR